MLAKKLFYTGISAISVLALVTGCGGSSSPSKPEEQDNTAVGIFVDAQVAGLAYQQGERTGTTNDEGEFTYETDGGRITFSVGSIVIGEADGAPVVTPYTLAPDDETRAINIAQFLQSLDSDGNPDNGINVGPAAEVIADGDFDIDFTETNETVFTNTVSDLVIYLANESDELTDLTLVSREDAVTHLEQATSQKFDYSMMSNVAFLIDYEGAPGVAFFDDDNEGQHGMHTLFADTLSEGGPGGHGYRTADGIRWQGNPTR